MSKFQVNDLVVYVGDTLFGPWGERKRNKTVGRVTEVSGIRESRYSVEYKDEIGVGHSPEAHLAPAYPIGTKVRGTASMPRFAGEVLTGTVLSEPQPGDTELSIRTEPTAQRYIEMDSVTFVTEPDPFEDLENAKVLRYTGPRFNRKYLHKVPGEGYQLSYGAYHIDGAILGTKPNLREAMESWFDGDESKFEIVTKEEPKEEESETVSEKRALIGPKPVVQGPKYQAPFRADYDRVKDANGRTIVQIDLEFEYESGEDAEMASVIADALNAKFNTPRFPGVTDDLRVAVRADEDPSEAEDFAYELYPGRFWWVGNRDEAIAAKTNGATGWVIRERNDLKDANTGEMITS